MKKNRLLVLLLLIAMLMTSFQYLSWLKADDPPAVSTGRELAKEDITNTKVVFFNGREVVMDKQDPPQPVTELPVNVTVANNLLPGNAYTGFQIDIDLSDISDNSVEEERQLKSGDVLRVRLPEYFWISKDTIRETKVYQKLDDGTDFLLGYVEEDFDSSDRASKNDIIITFHHIDSEGVDLIKKRESVKIRLEFMVTIRVSDNGDNDSITELDFPLNFNIVGHTTNLNLKVKKINEYRGHILRKTTGGTDFKEGEEYIYYKYSLTINRSVKDFKHPILIRDELKNGDGKNEASMIKPEDWAKIEIDTAEFKLVQGTFDNDKINAFYNADHSYKYDGSIMKHSEGRDPTPPVLKTIQKDVSVVFKNGADDSASDIPKFYELRIADPKTAGFILSYRIKVPKHLVNKGYVIKNVATILEDGDSGLQVLDPNLENNRKNEITRRVEISGTASGVSALTGRILIIKKDDSAEPAPIKGAKFKLKKTDDPVMEIAEKATGEDGRVEFENLKLGTYEVIETFTPNGYIAPADSVVAKNVKLEESNLARTVNVINAKDPDAPAPEPKKGSITIKKFEMGTDTAIEGVKFTIGKNEAEAMPQEYTTDSEGKIVVNDLDMGSYIIKEISAAQGYQLDPEAVEIELVDEDGKRDVEKIIYNTKMLIPEPKKGSIEIQKVDAILNEPLKGGKFEILNSAGEVVQTIISAQDGMAKAEGLVFGTYSVKEIEAPSGYEVDTKIHTVEINAEEAVKLKIKNKLKAAPTPTPSENPPDTDNSGQGTVGSVERITPKNDSPKEEPKPNPDADGIGGPGEPEPTEPPADGIGGFVGPDSSEPPSDSITGITGGGAGSGENDTDVLPGMIPGLTGGGTGAGDPNSAVAPGHIGSLPKTGEGLNASSYALFFGFIGMSFVIYGVYMKRAKKQ